jgi:hypothetical protein
MTSLRSEEWQPCLEASRLYFNVISKLKRLNNCLFVLLGDADPDAFRDARCQIMKEATSVEEFRRNADEI